MSIVGSDYAKTETGAFDVFFGDLVQFTILKYRIKMNICIKSNINCTYRTKKKNNIWSWSSKVRVLVKKPSKFEKKTSVCLMSRKYKNE